MTYGRRKGSRTREAVTSAAAIARTLAIHGISEQIRANRLLTEWAELVGPKIAQRTRPEGIVDRILWIEVATSAWLHELNLLRDQLVAGLCERLGEPRLFDDVKFRLAGRHRGDGIAARPGRRSPTPKPAPAPATGAAREAIVRDVAGVADEELRELIARVRITHDK